MVHSYVPDPYLYVDWGPAFRSQHDRALPEHIRAALSFSLGPLALQFLLQHGGRGFFRTRVVQRYLDEGLLKRVEQAPEFSYPVYLVYPRAAESPAPSRPESRPASRLSRLSWPSSPPPCLSSRLR